MNDASRTERFPARYRLKGRTAFSHVLDAGIRASDRALTVWIYPNRTPNTRLGIIVSRRHGNAVVRNRLKRQLREAFRLNRARLPAGLDLVVKPRVGVELDHDKTRQALPILVDKLVTRLDAS